MRTVTYPKEGFFAFQSKTNPDECPLMVYLAKGLKIEDFYNEITEDEYNAIQAAQAMKEAEMMEAWGQNTDEI